MFHTGMIVNFAGENPPPGWLLCDGFPVPEGDEFDALRAMMSHVPRMAQWGTGRSETRVSGGSVQRTVGSSESDTLPRSEGTSRSSNTGYNRSVGTNLSYSEGRSWSGPPISYIIKI